MIMTLSQKTLQRAIETFLEGKSLSLNSQKSYGYDLEQFITVTRGEISPDKLRLYESFLDGQAPSVAKRKQSTVNQFLWFLYEKEFILKAYRLQVRKRLVREETSPQLIDKSLFYQETDYKVGQLIALLMIELGLTPAELADLKCEDISLDFKTIRLVRLMRLRVLEVKEELLPYLSKQLSNTKPYLFSHQGKAYSRQWYFKQLRAFLVSIGLEEESAKSLRVQYILHEKEAGLSASTIARQLGLQSAITVEKYF
ncbi:site-specific tyrosine recombinase XerD [Streptococcus sp. zg-JUN1979]